MSRLDRLSAALGRLTHIRRAAEREQQRLEREASERGEAEARGGGEAQGKGGAEAGEERLVARARRAVIAGAPTLRAPEAPPAEPVTEPSPPPQEPPPPRHVVVLPYAEGGKPAPATMIPWGVRVASEAGWRLLVLAACVWVLVQVVSSISLLVMSFTAGLLVTALLQPFVGWLKRIGFGRGAATALTALGGLAVIGLIGWFVVWQVIDNSEDLANEVQDGIGRLRNWLLDLPFDISEENLDAWVADINDWISENQDTLTSAGLEATNYVLEFVTGAGITLFVVLFLLYDGPGVWQWFLKLIPSNARPAVAGAGPRAWITLTGYVRGTVIVALIDAVGIGLGLVLVDVPLAIPLAVIVFVSSFVPLVGAIASGALAVVVTLVTHGVVEALIILGVVLLVQQIEGHILQPFILGRMVRVHPLAVVLGVAGGSLLAGIPGAVVAVPLIAVTNTVIAYLRAYHDEAQRRAGVDPASGATVAEIAPTPAPSRKPPPSTPSAGGTQHTEN
ncbi:AI-2E family transporter [Streptomyces sp. 4N509B]|uniref:AI-2E family transporter n=1 Tax=Streptomyces sp. 4N509B TaxID=3457413 RepID=UPI003FD51DB7